MSVELRLPNNYSDSVVLYEEGHIYKDTVTSKVYTSVTTFIKEFYEEFDSEWWSYYKAIERLAGGKSNSRFVSFNEISKDFINDYGKEEGRLQTMRVHVKKNPHWPESKIREVQNKILLEWEEKGEIGRSRGTAWHDKQEEKAHKLERLLHRDNEYKKLSPLYKGNASKEVKVSSNLPDGYYVEIMVTHPLLMLAGKLDRLYIETIDGVKYGDIIDWKTDVNLFTDDSGKAFRKKMKPPIEHLEDNKLNKYGLQLNLYAFLCTCYGIVPRSLAILHVRDQIREFPIKLIPKEVESMIRHRLKTLGVTL